jgi:hypothetical protein
MQAGRLAIVAGLVGVVEATLLGAIATSNEAELGAPPAIPTLVVFSVLYGTPGVVGVIGGLSGRRILMVAAGVAYVFFSPLSFAGVTLMFLLPSILLFRAAVSPRRAVPTRPLRPGRLLLAVVICAPIALWLVLHLGIVAILLPGILGGLAQGFGRATEAPRLTRADALLGICLIGLLVGALFAELALTETVCWVAYGAPSRPVYRPVPATDADVSPVGGPDGSFASGCNSGQPSPQGVGVAGVLDIGAVALSVLASGRSLKHTTGGRLRSELN